MHQLPEGVLGVVRIAGVSAVIVEEAHYLRLVGRSGGGPTAGTDRKGPDRAEAVEGTFVAAADLAQPPPAAGPPSADDRWRGEVVRFRRSMLALKQGDLASAAACSVSEVADIEAGRPCDLAVLGRVTVVLGLSAADLRRPPAAADTGDAADEKPKATRSGGGPKGKRKPGKPPIVVIPPDFRRRRDDIRRVLLSRTPGGPTGRSLAAKLGLTRAEFEELINRRKLRKSPRMDLLEKIERELFGAVDARSE